MTLFIGSRGSAKYCRIYEKGRQLGDPDSPWVRFEVEYRKADSVLPIDMLIKPGQYLTGGIPDRGNAFSEQGRTRRNR